MLVLARYEEFCSNVDQRNCQQASVNLLKLLLLNFLVVLTPCFQSPAVVYIETAHFKLTWGAIMVGGEGNVVNFTALE